LVVSHWSFVVGRLSLVVCRWSFVVGGFSVSLKKKGNGMSENLQEGQKHSPEEEKDHFAEQQQQELARRREAGELAPYDYEVIYIQYLQQDGEPVTLKDVENHAIVINPDEFETLGFIEFVKANGEIINIDFTDEGFDRSHPLIIFLEELGDKKSSE